MHKDTIHICDLFSCSRFRDYASRDRRDAACFSFHLAVAQVFVMGGRIAWVHADPLFNETKTAVHLYNDGAHVVAASNVRCTTTALLRTCALNTPPPPLTRAQSDVLWHDTCIARSVLESKTLHQHIALGNACSSLSCLCPMLTTIDSIPTATACHCCHRCRIKKK